MLLITKTEKKIKKQFNVWIYMNVKNYKQKKKK